MTRYVLDPGAALGLAKVEAKIPARHKLLAPTLLRSQVLAQLYAQVAEGKLARAEATRQLDYLRGLQMRLLGDRVLQRVAWDIASELAWKDTLAAEYLALVKLHADALVTVSEKLARAARKVVPVATLDDLLG
jgi:predicted nucleic acid-binding protein